ncbi:MAG TPA: hypothetical protein VOA87_16360, partial [Thermoanaerobaculia bacterium]|nr:hypothetical protein [Thermoanaerobaculia bacterium]
SGFVAPRLAREMLASPTTEGWHIAADYNFFLNQAFAMLYAVASSTAIVLWSAAITRGGQLARGVGIYGLLLGPLTILVVGSGHLRLGVHGFGMVVLTQAVWFIVVGVLLLRRQKDAPDLSSKQES